MRFNKRAEILQFAPLLKYKHHKYDHPVFSSTSIIFNINVWSSSRLMCWNLQRQTRNMVPISLSESKLRNLSTLNGILSMYPFGISFDNVVHIFWTADFPTIIHPLTAILTTCIYDKHVHSWIEFVNIQSARGMCRIDAVDVQSWCDLLRRDEAGFPDFEDIDLPPSSFMWNQQSEWEAMESFLQQSQIVSSCYCVVWKWKKDTGSRNNISFYQQSRCIDHPAAETKESKIWYSP